MLKLRVYLHNERLCTSATFKPTSLSVPLSLSSSHPLKIHKTWPKATLANFLSLCSTQHDARRVGDRYINRFVKYGAHEHIMMTLVNTLKSFLSRQVTHLSHHRCREDNVVWVVVPYHPYWRSVYQVLTSSFESLEQALAYAGFKKCVFRLSFRNILKPAQVTLCSINSCA